MLAGSGRSFAHGACCSRGVSLRPLHDVYQFARRKASNVEQMEDFPQRVLAAMREGQEAQKRLEPDAELWPMPSYALFALQKQG